MLLYSFKFLSLHFKPLFLQSMALVPHHYLLFYILKLFFLIILLFYMMMILLDLVYWMLLSIFKIAILNHAFFLCIHLWRILRNHTSGFLIILIKVLIDPIPSSKFLLIFLVYIKIWILMEAFFFMRVFI